MSLKPSALRLSLSVVLAAVAFSFFPIGTVAKEAKPCIPDSSDPGFSPDDSETLDYYRVRPKQKHAKVFKLDYHQTSKTISINTAEDITYVGDEDADLIKKHFFRQCGSTLEPGPEHVADFLVDLPVRHVVITATPQIGYLMTLNMLDVAAVYIGDPEWVSDKCFAERINQGLTLVFDSETEFADALEDPNHEHREKLDELIESTQSLLLGPIYSDERLKDNRYIPMIEFGLQYKEQTPAGIFEWAEAFGAIFNEEREAQKLTKIKEKRWQCIEKKVANKWSRDIFERSTLKPRVCWAYHLDYKDDWGSYFGWVWASPCRSSEDEEDEYYCQMARACGAELGTGENSGGWSANIYNDTVTEQMFENCDAIIYSNYLRNIGTPQHDLLKRTKAYKSGRVYDLTKRGPSNWHEMRVAMYDYALEDFCSVAGTHSSVKKHRRMFLRRVDTEPEGVDPECKYVSTTDESGRRTQISCNTIGFKHQCHRFPECKKVASICEDQKRCRNKNFWIRYDTESGESKRGRVRCKRVSRKPELGSGKRFACDNSVVSRKCAKHCGECCPQYTS